AVKQRLVGVLQRAQINMLVEIVAARGELVPAMRRLLVLRLHRRRQQAQQAVLAALGLREGRALGGQCIEKGCLPSLFVSHSWHPVWSSLAADSALLVSRSSRIDH